MKNETDKNIEKIRQIIESRAEAKNLAIEKIILFGSRARMDNDNDSDFDILLVVGQDIGFEEKIALFKEINNALAGELIPSDIIIKTESEFSVLSRQAGTISYEAEKEGVAI